MRDRHLDLEQVPQLILPHNTTLVAYSSVLPSQPAETSSDALPVSQGRSVSEFLQRSEGRFIQSYPRFERSLSEFSPRLLERSLSASAPRSNAMPAERSLGNVFPRFKRSLSESLSQSHERSQPYFLRRSEERSEEVFLPVLEVYSTLQPPQEVPEIQILPLVENHGPISQEVRIASFITLYQGGNNPHFVKYVWCKPTVYHMC